MTPFRARALLLPLVVLVALAVAVAAPRLLQGAGWLRVAQALQDLQALAATNLPAAAAIYMLLYAGTILCLLPLGPAMGVGGGAVLGLWLGAACAVAGATAGSVVLALLARGVLGRALAPSQRAMIERLRPRLERNGFAVVLSLRLLVVTPGWLINLAAGATGMRLLPFAAGTALGILPASLVFASIGASLGSLVTSPVPPGLGLITRPDVLLPLLALTALSLVPVALQNRTVLRRALRRA